MASRQFFTPGLTTKNSLCSSCDLLLTGVRATLLGRAKVEWTECMAVSCRRRHVKKKEVYIDEEVYVFGSREP